KRIKLACHASSPVPPIFTETVLPAHKIDVTSASAMPSLASRVLECACACSPAALGACTMSAMTPPTHSTVPPARVRPKRSPCHSAPATADHSGYDEAMASAVVMP